jgi:hypothetical protein
MPLVELLYTLFELLIFQKVKLDDALNGRAATWARNHQHLFPLDTRPLKRRTVNFDVTTMPAPNAEAPK